MVGGGGVHYEREIPVRLSRPLSCPAGTSRPQSAHAYDRCRGISDSYLRLIDSRITQLKAQGPSRTCNESKEEEEEDFGLLSSPGPGFSCKSLKLLIFPSWLVLSGRV